MILYLVHHFPVNILYRDQHSMTGNVKGTFNSSKSYLPRKSTKKVNFLTDNCKHWTLNIIHIYTVNKWLNPHAENKNDYAFINLISFYFKWKYFLSFLKNLKKWCFWRIIKNLCLRIPFKTISFAFRLHFFVLCGARTWMRAEQKSNFADFPE